MHLFRNASCLSFVLLLFSMGSANTIDSIGNEILGKIWRFHPVDATYLGIHTYDTLLADYSTKALNRMLYQCKDLNKKLDKIDTLTLSVEELVDYHLLKINLINEIYAIEKTRTYERYPFIYVNECIYGVYTILIRSAPATKKKISAIKQRLKQIPAFLENAAQNLKRPAQFICEFSIGQLNEGENLIEDIFIAYQDSLSEKEKKEFQQAKNKAIAAMKWFAYWLEKHGDPNASYVLGKEMYEYKLKNIHLLDITADSLLNLGKNILASTNKMIDSLKKIYRAPPSKKITLPPDFGKGDVMAYRKEEIQFMRNFVAKSNLVTVPDWVGELVPTEIPGFLRGIIPGIAMEPPGTFDNSTTSYFYVQPLPKKFNHNQAEHYYNYVQNRSFRGSVVHEGYPGHHLQISIANHHPSSIRRSFSDYFLIEGWALYCDELMAKSGLYEDTLGAIINTLKGIQFRAARVIVDVMLQTGKYKYHDAVSFMREVLKGDSTFYAREVIRYITSPGQPSSYLVGKLQIQELRDEYKKNMGGKFNLKEFHDKLLDQGSIPVKLIRKLIIPEVD